MAFSRPPEVLLASFTLNRAISSFVGRMARAFQAAARVPVEQSFGVLVPEPIITSWFRGKELNESVGGEEFSQHRFALAFDMEGETDKLQNVVTEAKRVGLVAFVNDDENTAHFQFLPAGSIPASTFAILERVLGES